MKINEIQLDPGGWVTIDGDIRIRFRHADDGRLEPVAVEMIEGIISNRELQRVPFGLIEATANSAEVADLIRDRINAPEKHETVTLQPGRGSSGLAELVEQVKAVIVDPPRPDGGRVVYPDSFFEDIASLYTLFVAEYLHRISDDRGGVDLKAVVSEPKLAPVKSIAERLGVPISTVRRWVRVCRKRDLLPEARHGKGG